MEKDTQQLIIGYHIHLVVILEQLYKGNNEKAEELMQSFVQRCAGKLTTLIYTPHSDLLALHRRGYRCCSVVYDLMKKYAASAGITIMKGVEVGCLLPGEKEGVHIGVVPYDQDFDVFDHFSRGTMKGLNCFSPLPSKGEPQRMFPLKKVLSFSKRALLVYNHPEINTQTIQEKMLPLLKKHNLITEWNLAWYNTRSLAPIFWRDKGKRSFEAYRGIVGWDLHGVNGCFDDHFTTLELRKEPSFEVILRALGQQKAQLTFKKASLLNIVERVHYQIQEFRYALIELKLRNEAMR